MTAKPIIRPVDTAITSAERMLSALRRAKEGNYPPGITAHLYTAIHEHAQLKFHIDRQLQSEGAAWARLQKDKPEQPHRGIDHVLPPDIAAFYGLEVANETTRLLHQGRVVPSEMAEDGTGEVTPDQGDAIAAPCDETREAIRTMGFGKIPVEAA